MLDALIPVADAHSDFLYQMIHAGASLSAPKPGQHLSLEGFDKGGVALQAFAAWIDRRQQVDYLAQCLQLIDAYWQLHEHYDALVHLSAQSLEEVTQRRRIGTLLTIEGGEAMGNDVSNLRIFKRLGVCAMSLTWNHRNNLAIPATAKSAKGVSPLGKLVVEEMSRIKMAVDVSHLNDAGIVDVLSYGTLPPMASHSNARSLCDHPRNLLDEHIEAIAKSGGFIGVNFFPAFLVASAKATLDDVVAHIEYIAALGGIDCVGFGSDFDGIESTTQGLKTSADYPNLIEMLLKRNFSEDDVRKIAGDNFLRYILPFVS